MKNFAESLCTQAAPCALKVTMWRSIVMMMMMMMMKRLMMITVGVLALFLMIPLVNGYIASGNLVSVHIRAIRT